MSFSELPPVPKPRKINNQIKNSSENDGKKFT